MGLDIELVVNEPIKKTSTGIYVRQGGKNRELSLAEAKELYPDADIKLHETFENCVYSDNITHNLNVMAEAVGLYEVLWHPRRVFGDEVRELKAKTLVPYLASGFEKLISQRTELEKLNPSNGWGNYDGLVKFVLHLMVACIEHPEAVYNAEP